VFRYFLLSLVFGIAAACSPANQGQPASVQSAPEEAPVSECLPGQRAYEEVCANCHETGLDGAPAVGDREAWENRSSLWVAVLTEHATEGYLGMPPKGGDPSLSDAEICAAVAYMMTLTHPEQPPE